MPFRNFGICTKSRLTSEDIASVCQYLPLSFVKQLTPDMTVDEAYALYLEIQPLSASTNADA
ncbi:MAG: hypothetical protein LBT59_27100 [Clostridiales bacterium]|nr:hypothetical protein [Clostridiales bacterium]